MYKNRYKLTEYICHTETPRSCRCKQGHPSQLGWRGLDFLEIFWFRDLFENFRFRDFLVILKGLLSFLAQI